MNENEFRDRQRRRQIEINVAASEMRAGAAEGDVGRFFRGFRACLDGYALRPAFLKLGRLPVIDPRIRSHFAHTFVTNGDDIRERLNDDRLLIETFRRLLPTYEGGPLRLYRGDSAANRRNRTYGASWSASREIAEQFAEHGRRYYDGGSVVVSTLAPPEAIIFAPALMGAHYGDAEEEYVLDRRQLGRVKLLARLSPIESA